MFSGFTIFFAVSSKGYKFTTTISIVLISKSFSCCKCLGLSLLARIPPCIFGFNVLTLPSSISGKPVTSDISLQSIEFSFNVFAVPPLEIMSNPKDFNSLANSTIPVLLQTLNSAIAILIFSLI